MSADQYASLRNLIEAARAVVERWDSPKWKDAEHTGVLIARLREQVAEYANCSDPDTILRLLTDMDAEAMPNERRAEILAGMIMRATGEDRAWAASAVEGLPDPRDERIVALEEAARRALPILSDRYAGGRMMRPRAEAGEVFDEIVAALTNTKQEG